MKKILLNIVNKKSKNYKKYSALIDDEDFDLVNKYNWSVDKQLTGNIYAMTMVGSGKRERLAMHNLIMGKKGIDHIDGNGLNNQRSNLRVATHLENCRNQKKRKSPTSSKYKGVCIYKQKKDGKTYIRCESRIKFGGKRIRIGLFKNETDAAKAYNQKALELFGEFAHLNEIN